MGRTSLAGAGIGGVAIGVGGALGLLIGLSSGRDFHIVICSGGTLRAAGPASASTCPQSASDERLNQTIARSEISRNQFVKNFASVQTQ